MSWRMSFGSQSEYAAVQESTAAEGPVQIGLAGIALFVQNTPNYSEVFACPVRPENRPKPFRL